MVYLRSKIILLICLFFQAGLIGLPETSFAGSLPQDENHPLIKAAQDEIQRSIQSLKINGNPPPYFIGLSITDTKTMEIQAQNGSILVSWLMSFRNGTLNLRVGSYEFDQTDFISENSWDSGNVPLQFSLSLDDDYTSIRKHIWLAVDHQYKRAIEHMEAKKAFYQTHSKKDLPFNLSREKTVRFFAGQEETLPDQKTWERRIRKYSEIFNEYPEIDISKIIFKAYEACYSLVNSEGTVMVQPFFHVRLKAEIHAQAQDGADLHDYLDIPAVSVNDIPDDEEVFSRLHLMAQTMRARLQAKSAADDMAPVLFQGQAAAEFFGQLLADNLGAPRVAVIGTDENRFNPFMNKNENPLKSYINRILLPESINVIDDPTLKGYKGKDLLSHYKYDYEGVAGQKMVVVEKGKFKKFLNSRTPTKYSEKSDGHAIPRPMGFFKGTISNLLIKGDKGKSSRKLIKALRKLCKKQGLSHGYLVTRIAPRAVSNNLNPDMFFNMMAGKSQDESMLTPLVVYKIDAKSGKKELVRNASFAGVGVDLLSKISAYSKEVDLYSFGVSNPAGGFGFGPPLEVAICSIVCPDVLVEKMSIRERTAKKSFRPYLENPLHKNQVQPAIVGD